MGKFIEGFTGVFIDGFNLIKSVPIEHVGAGCAIAIIVAVVFIGCLWLGSKFDD